MKRIQLVLAVTAAFAAATSHAQILPTSYSATTVSLSTNNIVYNDFSNELLVSVPSYAGYGVGNSITRISMGGQILSSQFVGSAPGQVVLSADGLTGYVALHLAPSIKRFDALTGAVTGTIALPDSTYRAEDIAVSPDNPNVIAVSLRNTCCSPRHEGVGIYQNGQLLPQLTADHTGSNTIEFGADGKTLYGYNNETTDFGYRIMSVNGSGVTTTSVTSGALYGFNKTFTYDSGLAFSSTGEVFNPATGEQLGAFSLPSWSAAFTASVEEGRAYALAASGALTVYDLATFTPMATYKTGLKGISQFTQLIHTHDGHLAALSTGKIHILTAVPEADALWMAAAGLALMGLVARTRAKRQPQQANG